MTQELITALLANNDIESRFMLEDMLQEKIESAIAHRKIELAATMMEDMDANGVIQLSPQQKRIQKAKKDHADAVEKQNDADGNGDDQDDDSSSKQQDTQQNSDDSQDDQSDSQSSQNDDNDKDDQQNSQDDDSDEDDDKQTKKPAFLKKDVKEAFRPDHKNGRAIGEFQEKDHGKWFTYRHTNDPWAKKHGLTHEIDVGDNEIRFGNIKSTRAHIATDENDDGTPKLDTWHLKKHNRWQHNEDVELEEAKKQDRFHIVTKGGKPANLVSYSSLSAAKADRDANHPGHIIHQVGPRGSIKHVFEDVTDYNPKSQGGTRKELLALYAKTKDPKHAEAARKAGATQMELKACHEAVELDEISQELATNAFKKRQSQAATKAADGDYMSKEGKKATQTLNRIGNKFGVKVADKLVNEMAMDAIKHPTHGRIEWRNENGAHMITTKGANGSLKIHKMGSHAEIAGAWAKLKSKLMTEDINWISDK